MRFEDSVDVLTMPQTTQDYVQQCLRMDSEKLQRLIYPKTLKPNQDEWLRLHERLNHIHYPKLRRLCDKGVLHASLAKIHSLPSFPSCAFGESKCRKWHFFAWRGF